MAGASQGFYRTLRFATKPKTADIKDIERVSVNATEIKIRMGVVTAQQNDIVAVRMDDVSANRLHQAPWEAIPGILMGKGKRAYE